MLSLPGRITLHDAAAARQALASALQAERGPTLRLDAAPLQRFDSSAIAVLLDLRRQARESGRSLELVGLPRDLLELARLYGVDGLLVGTAGDEPAAPVASSPPVR